MIQAGDDGRFGRRAVARGWLGEEELERSLHEVEARRKGGEKVALGRHLVERSLLSPAQVRDLLAEQDKQVLVCSSTTCGKRFNIRDYRRDRTYRCKDCGARLAAPGPDRTEMIVREADEAGESAATLLAVGPSPEESWSTGFGATLAPGAPRPRRPERSFGRYVEAAELARGGMGAVYRAIDPDLGRPVAIKVILGEGDAASGEEARFLREAQVTGQLQHPNIPPLHELSRTPDGRTYFAMKLIDGSSLADVVAERVRQGPEALAAARGELLGALVKVCDALAYAHSRGVIHRDLKPANVMIGAYGEVLVMDWGIARVLGTSDVAVPEAPAKVRDLDPVRTLEGTVMGTPAYMSPEQVEGRLDEIDAKSDVYSLGAVIYEVLSGTPPFSDKTIDEIFDRIAAGALEPPGRRTPAARIPAELDRLTGKAMHVRRAKRYASAEEVKAELQAFLEGRPIEAFRYTAWQRAIKWVRRNRAVSAVSAAATLLVTVLVARLFLALSESRANLVLARESAAAESVQRKAAGEERDRAAAALADVLALSEAAPLADRLSDDERLAAWRGFPARTEALEAWLERARAFEGRRPHHERRIREIEARGEAEESDRWEKANRLRLVELLVELERAVDVARDGLDRARALRSRSDDAERAAWDEAAREGLTLPRTPGLVPIGRDQGSGLWEFWLIESGDRPERGRDGRLALEPGSGIVLVLLPGGTFRMGSDRSPLTSVKPPFDATVPAFLISKYEITLQQWARATGARAPAPEEALRPADQVTWEELRPALGRWGLRLPSDSEWEYAARAGTTGDRWTDDLATAENVIDQAAVRGGAPRGEPWDDGEWLPRRVGKYRSNPFGLHDVLGNVTELCEDDFASTLLGAPADGSPRREPGAVYRVVRGGNCVQDARSATSFHRDRFAATLRNAWMGARPAMDLPAR